MKNTLAFYTAIFLRRIHYFLIVFLLVSAASLTLARILPPVYTSQTALLVESSQIPTNLAEPTVQTGAAEELQIIEQRLMTRINLLDIARSQNVFDDMGSMTADEIVRRMRQNTDIRRSAGRGQATLMDVSFSSDNGRTAANVVNQYVTIILQDNAESRADRAGDTLQFFETEVERLGVNLKVQSAKILEFKNANSKALPDTLVYRLNQQSALQARLATVERDMAALNEEKRRLNEIFAATGQIGTAAGSNLTPDQRQLAKIQDDLRRALALYTPEHPSVKVLEAQLIQQRAIVTGQSADTGANTATPTTMLDITLAGIDARVDLLTTQGQRITTELADLVETIDKTAANSIILAALDRDYANIQQQYNTAVNGLSKAAIGERIELSSRGQRIAVLDPATVPDKPASPNRLLIGAGGTLLGAFLGFGLIAALEFLNNSIRRPTEITQRLGITPIATVPYIRTPMELVIRRATFVLVFAFVIIGVPAALFAIHTYYLPLDLIYDRVAERIGTLI